MKKVALSALALTLALGFAGCSKKEEAKVEVNNTTVEVSNTTVEANATEANATEANNTTK